MPEQPMTAAQLRDRAIRILNSHPKPAEVAEADVWARLALSAAISETGTRQETADEDH